MAGTNVAEIGSGAHAITTVPLAYMVGSGQVVAVELERWRFFREIVIYTGLEKRIFPLACDATSLPIPDDRFDLCVTVHAARSMHSEDNMVRIIREGLRVSARIFLAESLPNAKTESQQAHLEMYNLREAIFEAVLGEKDDIHYLPIDRLLNIVEKAGGRVTDRTVLDTNLPHYSAFIPREYVEKVRDPGRRSDLLERWDLAMQKLTLFGEEQPPVAVLNIARIEK